LGGYSGFLAKQFEDNLPRHSRDRRSSSIRFAGAEAKPVSMFASAVACRAQDMPKESSLRTTSKSNGSRAIMDLAGGLGDRRSRSFCRPREAGNDRGREESPDTVLSHQEKGNAPGNARGAVAGSSLCYCSRKVPQRIDRRRSSTVASSQVNLGDVFPSLVSLGKGEKVG
jgi:hypothetical protein